MDKDVKRLNENNEWLRFLETGDANPPFLKNKPKTEKKIRHVSNGQRQVIKNMR